MIIKSKSFKSNKAFYTVVDYLLRESEKDKGFVLTRFFRGKDLSNAQISKQFLENEKYRINPRKNNVKLYMDIISFHKDDKDISNEKLKKIARKYLSLRSNLSMALVTVHRNEKQHTHLHILLSGISYKTGCSVRISKSDFLNKVKVPMEQYQSRQFPLLERSKINHKKNIEFKKKSR